MIDDSSVDLYTDSDKIQVDSPKKDLEDDIKMEYSEKIAESNSDDSVFKSMKLSELQEECKSRGLAYYGTKAIVRKRLEDSFS